MLVILSTEHGILVETSLGPTCSRGHVWSEIELGGAGRCVPITLGTVDKIAI